jgi:hypothetical protein
MSASGCLKSESLWNGRLREWASMPAAILRDASAHCADAPQDEGSCLLHFNNLRRLKNGRDVTYARDVICPAHCTRCRASGERLSPVASNVIYGRPRHLCGKGHLCAAIVSFVSTISDLILRARATARASRRMAAGDVIYVIYARNVIYEAAVARTASSASGVSTSSSAPVSVGTSATAS